MARCAGFKPSGEPCERIVKASQTYCFSHDPERAEQRKRNASKAGKGGGSTEIRGLKRRIAKTIEAVLDGSQDRGRAAVAIQGFNALRGVLELERRVREQEEFEERLAALERASEDQKGARWGAR